MNHIEAIKARALEELRGSDYIPSHPADLKHRVYIAVLVASATQFREYVKRPRITEQEYATIRQEVFSEIA
ncbi:hypothetical protein [Bradyrhizobium sp. USDA 313]|uniref:hypothetical protein n=1 Tax=Bradyrhizobium sp. USDA 313 TaxID=3156307 RepID=UPI003511B4C8